MHVSLALILFPWDEALIFFQRNHQEKRIYRRVEYGKGTIKRDKKEGREGEGSEKEAIKEK